jgi:hypothetical protein
MTKLSQKPLLSGRSSSTLRAVPTTGWSSAREEAWIAEQEMLREQRLIVLQEGDTVTITGDRTQVWWFVADVRPPERIVTARTLIVEKRLEEDLPFVRVKPLELTVLQDQADANWYRGRLQLVTRKIEMNVEQDADMRAALPRRLRTHLFEPGKNIQHIAECECSQCRLGEYRRAA